MKGFVKITKFKALKAVENFKSWRDDTKKNIDSLTDDYKIHYFSNANFIQKFLHRNKPAGEILKMNISCFGSYDEELWKVTDDETLICDIRKWCYGVDREECKTIERLCSVANYYILIDNELAAFVGQWENVE